MHCTRYKKSSVDFARYKKSSVDVWCVWFDCCIYKYKYNELLSILCKLDLADETARNTQLMTTCQSLHQQPTRLGSTDHSILEDLRL